MSARSLPLWFVFTGLLALVGCDSKTPERPRDCAPQCNAGCGGDDACGGTCACPSGEACGGGGVCIPASACTDTCAALGASCGNVCGQSCGTCSDGTTCVEGACLGTVEVGCADCSLRLSLLDSVVEGGAVKRVTLALDYLPRDGQPAPRLADFRLKANRVATLTNVESGQALTDAGKNFYLDPVSQKPWRQRADGSFQVLALSMDNTNRVGSGRLATFTFDVNAPSVAFSLQRREQMLAPPDADLAVQTSRYYAPVVVVP